MTYVHGTSEEGRIVREVNARDAQPPVERSIAVGDGSSVRGYAADAERAKAAQEANENADETPAPVVQVGDTKPVSATPRDPDAPAYGGGRPEVVPGTYKDTYVVDQVMARQLGIL